MGDHGVSVRVSSFRHVYGDDGAHRNKYSDLRVCKKQTDSLGVKGNDRFIAFSCDSGGGALAVLKSGNFGRVPHGVPLIKGHTAGILDWDFCPAVDNVIATASEDATVKIWSIPEDGLQEDIHEPEATLEGHRKKISFCSFNPCAEWVLASAAWDLTLKIWDVKNGAEISSYEVPDTIGHIKWNLGGSLLAVCCKDKKLRIIDPRVASDADGQLCTTSHVGPKVAKVEWLDGQKGDEHRLFTAGFSVTAQRQYAVWDKRKFDKELTMQPLDQQAGVMFPHFDECTGLLYLCGKGDGNVKYYEVSSELPCVHYINDYRSTTPQQGFAFIPKRGVDVHRCEMMRGLKLGENFIEQISFIVPRRSESFHEELFPPCISGQYSMTMEEWSKGANVPPLRISMDPGSSAPAKHNVMRDLSSCRSPPTNQRKPSSQSDAKSVQQEDHRVLQLESRVKDLEARLLAVEKAIKTPGTPVGTRGDTQVGGGQGPSPHLVSEAQHSASLSTESPRKPSVKVDVTVSEKNEKNPKEKSEALKTAATMPINRSADTNQTVKPSKTMPIAADPTAAHNEDEPGTPKAAVEAE